MKVQAANTWRAKVFHSATRSRINSATVALALLVCGLNPVWAQVEKSSPADKTGQEQLEELSLNDIQDVGILLRHIKQQSINVYEEAARRPVNAKDSADIPEITSIPIKNSDSAMLPARREWLVFFLATMEPVIRDLTKQVKDLKQGVKQIVIPEQLEKEIDPLWDKWALDVQEMNSHLDQLLPLFDDAPHNNQEIQKVAVKIFDDTNRLESIRKSVFKVMQQIEQKNPNSKIMISPDAKR